MSNGEPIGIAGRSSMPNLGSIGTAAVAAKDPKARDEAKSEQSSEGVKAPEAKVSRELFKTGVALNVSA